MPSSQPDFSCRATLAEWMDDPCTYEEFRACLEDLTKVNKLLGGYRPTLQWLEQFAGTSVRPLHIVDVGFGAGDMLRQIQLWARRKKIALRLTGVDLNAHAARAAREFAPEDGGIEWVTGDIFSFKPACPIDLVVSSLFTHHLPDELVVSFVRWMESVSTRGWFVNDLHRKRIFYHSFRSLAAVVGWHPFVRHDGPVSIQRSFTPEDWRRYVFAAGLGVGEVQIRNCLLGRLCVGRVK